MKPQTARPARANAVLLLGILAGLTPFVFPGSPEYVVLMILILAGITVVLILNRRGLAEKSLLLALGFALVFNPRKFIGGAVRGFFGVPQGLFLSLTDLIALSLLLVVAARAWSRGEKVFARPQIPVVLGLLLYLAALIMAYLKAPNSFFALSQLVFECKAMVLFLLMAYLNMEQGHGETDGPIQHMLYGLAGGLIAEGGIVFIQYLGLLPPDIAFMSLDVGAYNEVVAGSTLFRVGGTFGHPNFLSVFLAGLIMPLLVSAIKTQRFAKLWFSVALAAALVSLILTLSRAGWLGTGVSLLVFMAIGPSRRRIRLLLQRHQKALGVMAVVSLLVLAPFFGKIVAKLTASSPENIDSRVRLNVLALEMIKDHPLAGVGLNNAIVAGASYPIFQFFSRAFGYPPVVHNYFLLVTSEIGIPGLAAFLLFLLAVATRLRWKQGNTASPLYLRLGLFAGLLGYLTADMFGYSLRKYEVGIIFWWQLGVVVMLSRLYRDEASLPAREATAQQGGRP